MSDAGAAAQFERCGAIGGHQSAQSALAHLSARARRLSASGSVPLARSKIRKRSN